MPLNPLRLKWYAIWTNHGGLHVPVCFVISVWNALKTSMWPSCIKAPVVAPANVFLFLFSCFLLTE